MFLLPHRTVWTPEGDLCCSTPAFPWEKLIKPLPFDSSQRNSSGQCIILPEESFDPVVLGSSPGGTMTSSAAWCSFSLQKWGLAAGVWEGSGCYAGALQWPAKQGKFAAPAQDIVIDLAEVQNSKGYSLLPITLLSSLKSSRHRSVSCTSLSSACLALCASQVQAGEVWLCSFLLPRQPLVPLLPLACFGFWN